MATLETICGQLLVVGFDGTTLPEALRSRLGRGERGGAVLFKRNIGQSGSAVDLVQVAKLNAAIAAAAPQDLPPLIGVDQEGGRVQRLGPPVIQLPPMRQLGDVNDPTLVERVAKAVGNELSILGFTMSFAPVLDVDTNPANPVIGDRSFGREPRSVMRAGVAYLRGLQSAGVLACAKHFPGHGDTEDDSHLALPRVRHDRTRLMNTEIPPFRAAIGAGVAAVMTAHVVYDALDPGVPATLSRAIVGSLLRAELGFEGVCISDDLTMRGVSPSGGENPAEVVAVGLEAVAAGCDVLLVAHEGVAVDALHAAMVERAGKDPKFRARCEQSFERVVRIRRLSPPRPIVDPARLSELIPSDLARQALADLESALASGRAAF